MARQRRVDPGRDLLDLMAGHAQDSAKQTLPQLDTGTVLVVNDGTDGTVVQLDNMSVAASDCLTLGGYAPVVGDRVMVLVNQEEFWIIGGVTGQSTSASTAPSGPAGGDLSGTYPNPSVTSTALARAFQTGMIVMWGTGAAPSGWLLLDGSAVSRGGANAALFALWGTTFGAGDGSTTFNVANFKGRSPLGSGTGDASDATAHALGSKTGTEGAALTSIGQLAPHNHNSATIGLISPPTITTGGPSTNTTDSTTPGATGSTTPGNTGAAGTHSHGAINALLYSTGTTMVGGRISGSLNAGGGVTTIASGTITDTEPDHSHTSAAHTHTSAAHTHTMGNHTHSSTMPNHDHTVATDGNSDPHPNMHPVLTVNFIVKL